MGRDDSSAFGRADAAKLKNGLFFACPLLWASVLKSPSFVPASTEAGQKKGIFSGLAGGGGG